MAPPSLAGGRPEAPTLAYMLLRLLAISVIVLSCSTPAAREDASRSAEERLGGAVGEDTLALGPLPAPAVRDQALAHMRMGLELRRQGNAAVAEEAFDRAIQLVPHFRDWAHVVAAFAAAEARDSAAVRRRVERVRGGSAGEWGWQARVEVLREMGDSAGALQALERAAGAVGSPQAGAAAWAELGHLRRGAGDPDGALEAYRRAMELDGSTTGARDAARAAADLPRLGPGDRLLIGRTLLRHGVVDRGVAQIEAYLASGAGTEAERHELRLETGRALFRARNWNAAHRHLSAAAATSPEAALLAGRSEFRRGRQSEGRAALLALPRRFPRSDAAAQALFLIADLDHDAGRLSSARELYRQALATGSHSVAAADAAVRLATMAVLQRDHRTALADVERYLAGRPRDAVTAPAVYWAGRAHLLAGDRDRAHASFQEVLRLDPLSYYGARAADRLGTSLRQIPIGAPPEIGAEQRMEVAAATFRMDLLRDLGMNEAAELEMALLRTRMSGSPEALYLVAEGMIERGQPIAGALLGREIQRERGVWDERLLRIVFQFPYRDLVEREARRNGLDPFMVAGLIRQESFFNPVAVSPVGAVGLMQVMPATARGLAGRAGIRNFQPAMLRQPEVNVRLGTLFLADQMRRWGGNWTDTFAAYNAGPNRVARWRTYPEHADEEIYAERIPIAETRDYVKKVRFHTYVYRRLYGE